MVLLFNNLGHTVSRFMKGVDIVQPGDVLYLVDAMGRERLFQVFSIGGPHYSVNGCDLASRTYCIFQTDRIALTHDWSAGKGFLDFPSVTQWGVLYESGLVGREQDRSLVAPSFLAGEILLKRILDGTISIRDFLNERTRDYLFGKILDEEVVEELRAANNRDDCENPSNLSKLGSLRLRYPRELFYASYSQFSRSDKKAITIDTVNPAEISLPCLPYQPLESLLK